MDGDSGGVSASRSSSEGISSTAMVTLSRYSFTCSGSAFTASSSARSNSSSLSSTGGGNSSGASARAFAKRCFASFASPRRSAISPR